MKQLIKAASVCRKDDNRLVINIEKNGSANVALFWTKDHDSQTKNRELVQENVGDSITLQDPLNNQQRIYFILDTLDGQSKPYLFGERTLKVAGMTNLRDCGGYVGVDGKRIKWGVLYRSNHLHGLTEGSLAYIKALGIKAVIDFRSDREISKSPNEYIGENKTVNVDPSAHTAELAAQFAAKPDNENQDLIKFITENLPKDKVNGKGEQVLEQYRNFVNGDTAKVAFKDMLQAMLDKNNVPCVLHCRGGKDRTGYGVLLVMVILGISVEDIVYDYMLTRENRLERNDYKMSQYREITQDEDVLGYLLSLIDTREEFILEVLKTMKEVAGTPENYIKQELGLSEQDFLTLRDIFLE
ncbi:tyrosine-protein phosphatase [Zophobihabitans entericus]|uniref:Tyrosine-protein phosphatase n=1 Tax=Zophobihabitans entericus TaxID=1635327 RepID=A0A6G9ICM0_9GAMM|nr:tyrosine-protein phosphatase [Zophobihabitans entericus]QIQ21572.1 tyrosine-protein phosphatase [Zophobihabitans entericus]